MRALLTQLHAGTPLSAQQAEEAFTTIMSGQADPAQVGALLALLALRTPTTEEIIGAATVMRRNVVAIPASPDVVDTCGSGGVGSHFFNISTTAALIAAACGVPVAKHGNRSVTSRSGSADVLRVLGVNVETSPAQEVRCLETCGICFAFAPRHHPAMRHVAAIRQQLGFPTIFNAIGPLTNPAGSRRQVMGVRSPAVADQMLECLVRLGARRAMAVNGKDLGFGPLCELSVCGPTYIAAFDGTSIRRFEVAPEDVGLPTQGPATLEISGPEQSAAVIRGVLDGRPGAPRDIALLNAAAALWVGGKVEDLRQGVIVAAAALDSGAARATLADLVCCSHNPA
jgi:anthranilate phosphoribosyltransferase